MLFDHRPRERPNLECARGGPEQMHLDECALSDESSGGFKLLRFSALIEA
jgi:hypothetical protein